MVCCWNRYGLQEQHEIWKRSCYGYLTLRRLDQSRLAFQMMALTPLHVLSVQIRVGISDVGHEVPPQVSKDVPPHFNIATPLICQQQIEKALFWSWASLWFHPNYWGCYCFCFLGSSMQSQAHSSCWLWRLLFPKVGPCDRSLWRAYLFHIFSCKWNVFQHARIYRLAPFSFYCLKCCWKFEGVKEIAWIFRCFPIK